MSDRTIFDLRAQALRLISHTRAYETVDAQVSEGLAQFQGLQDSIRKSIQKIEEAQAAAQKAAAGPPAFIPPEITHSPVEPAAKRALPPGTRFETSQDQYRAALADQDVIQALLQLHDEVEIEGRIARQAQVRAQEKAAAAEEPALERVRPPQAQPVDFESMQFSRTRQTSRGIFSPILKPPRRDGGGTE